MPIAPTPALDHGGIISPKAGVATRAPKPSALSPLPFGAAPDYSQGDTQGHYDLTANLITALNGG